VSGVRPRSANARHECFVVDASVSVKTAETAEMDEERKRVADGGPASASHGKEQYGAELLGVWTRGPSMPVMRSHCLPQAGVNPPSGHALGRPER
jgi:hypothetical protein